MRAALFLVSTLLVAGCFSTPPPSPTSATCFGAERPSTADEAGFNGNNAFGHVLVLSCDYDAKPPVPRARVPGTSGRVAAADHIARTLEGAGWGVERVSFTGLEYGGLPKGSVATYMEPDMCSTSARERMRSLVFENVVADLGQGRDVTLVMAHYDSKRFATKDASVVNRTTQPVLGANDGASGVAVLLEAARVLGRGPPATHLRFLLVDGEDGFEDCHPLAGSIHYAQSHPPKPDHDLPVGEERITRVVLLDMVGDPQAAFCYGHNNATLRDAWVEAARAAGAAAFLGREDCLWIVDDHTAFKDQGYPVLDVVDADRPGTSFPPYWHTTHDTPARVSGTRLAETGRTLLEFLDAFSGA